MKTDMNVTELKYSSTNTYLICGRKGILLFDTGWAGTFPAFCREMGEKGIPVQDISCILISHFHPDHCGIAQEIADLGAVIAVLDVQKEFIHAADSVFQREPGKRFHPIDDLRIRMVPLNESRDFLAGLGIDGEIVATPGHSEDSISLCLDNGSFFVGDLNPLYELEMHRGTQIGASWELLLARHPGTIYYGHAKTAVLDGNAGTGNAGTGNTESGNAEIGGQDMPYGNQKAAGSSADEREYALVKRIMKYTDKGYSAEKIHKKTGASIDWIRDAMRMYLTHTNISVQGILDRLEIRGR